MQLRLVIGQVMLSSSQWPFRHDAHARAPTRARFAAPFLLAQRHAMLRRSLDMMMRARLAMPAFRFALAFDGWRARFCDTFMPWALALF